MFYIITNINICFCFVSNHIICIFLLHRKETHCYYWHYFVVTFQIEIVESQVFVWWYSSVHAPSSDHYCTFSAKEGQKPFKNTLITLKLVTSAGHNSYRTHVSNHTIILLQYATLAYLPLTIVICIWLQKQLLSLIKVRKCSIRSFSMPWIINSTFPVVLWLVYNKVYYKCSFWHCLQLKKNNCIRPLIYQNHTE